jgi:hypothetical protein
MRKLIAGATGVLVPLAIVPQVLAQTHINPCNGIDQFNALCGLSANNTGTIVSRIIQLLFVIAVIIAIFFLVWGGIKWIMSSGDKAKIEAARSTIIGGIIGLILVFLAFFVVQLIANIFGININNLVLPNIVR